jgi:hypothetical protein
MTEKESVDAKVQEILEQIKFKEPEVGIEAEIRAQSSQRMRYEAQVEVLKRQIGTLEEIRLKLGLSRRKICQLLLIDPSAWTRWTKNGEDAPPHIYRALEWYLLTEEKHPSLGSAFWLSSVARGTQTSVQSLEPEIQ